MKTLFVMAGVLCACALAQDTIVGLGPIDQQLMRAAMTGPTGKTMAWVFNEKTGAIEEQTEDAFERTVEQLLDSGANINARYPDGTTPLLIAVEHNNVCAINALVKRGADLSLKNDKGMTPLMRACSMKYKNLPVIQNLLKAGADANAANQSDITALMMAVSADREDAVRALIAYGADVEAETKDGGTALSIAKYLKLREMVKILRQHGAMK